MKTKIVNTFEVTSRKHNSYYSSLIELERLVPSVTRNNSYQELILKKQGKFHAINSHDITREPILPTVKILFDLDSILNFSVKSKSFTETSKLGQYKEEVGFLNKKMYYIPKYSLGYEVHQKLSEMSGGSHTLFKESLK